MAAPDDGTRRRLVIGLDCSTQSISAVVLDCDSRAVVHESSLRFDDELPQYGTKNGVIRDPRDPSVVGVPSLMLVDALDRIFAELATYQAKFKLQDVVGVSGSAQQHTSAYWRRGFSLRDCLDSADASTSLAITLDKARAFVRECGPSWMDSSTSKYCDQLEVSVGGAEEVARISGSRAYARFTGNQIAKLLDEDPVFLETTGRVSLASSLLTSLLIGDFAPIDASDASGMNLLDLSSGQWSPTLLEGTAKHTRSDYGAERLCELLGSVVASPHSILGSVHGFFQHKFGLPRDCRVVSFSGDNPCTLAGVGLSRVGDITVSLGTSSTLMAVVAPLDTSCAKDEGHFFLNPIDPKSLMAMICFQNGALPREDIKDQFASGQWSEFEALLTQSPVGNNGVLGFFMRDPEITPSTRQPGVVVYSDSNVVVSDPSVLGAATNVRAIVESQCLSLRLHAERLGIRNVQRLIATGGGSASAGFMQVLADVFAVPVLRLRSGENSAALGGAFRALHGLKCAADTSGFVSFDVDDALQFEEVAQPDAVSVAVYSALLPRFGRLEELVVRELN